MRVKVFIPGLLGRDLRVRNLTFEVAEGTTVGDLLLELGKRFGPGLPSGLWDVEAEVFNPVVRAARCGEGLLDQASHLRADDEILILSRVAGG